jgi:hypothetical protein
MGFGLVCGFIELLQIVTTSNIALWLIHTLCSSLRHVLNILSSVSSPMDVPLLPGSRPRRLAANSHQLPTLLIAVLRLPSNVSWSSVYNLGTDRTENTASNSYAIVACYTAVTRQWPFFWLHISCFEKICHKCLDDYHACVCVCVCVCVCALNGFSTSWCILYCLEVTV